MSDTPHAPSAPPDDGPVFDAAELGAMALGYEVGAVSADRFSQRALANLQRCRATALRDAIAAHEAVCRRAAQLEAQLAWVFRGTVVRNHLPICRADAEAHTAAETEDGTC